MPDAVKTYVRFVDAMNRRIGRIAMYLIFAIMGILLYSSIAKTFFHPSLWTLEMAQFTMTAYYILGGAYSMQLGDHVRMDLIYDQCSEKNKARLDVATSGCLLFYLGCLLFGSISSTIYAIETGQRKFSMWNPSMVPIKLIMVTGIVLMLLQAISMLFKDIAKARGVGITHEGERPTV